MAIQKFKDGSIDVLVCTDLGGRGLDVKGIQHVINFDAPRTIASYVHRIGRTGRAGLSGVSSIFLTASDELLFYDLLNFLKKNEQRIPEALEKHPASRIKPGAVG